MSIIFRKERTDLVGTKSDVGINPPLGDLQLRSASIDDNHYRCGLYSSSGDECGCERVGKWGHPAISITSYINIDVPAAILNQAESQSLAHRSFGREFYPEGSNTQDRRTTFWVFGKEKMCLTTVRPRILYMFSVGSTPRSHVLSLRADRIVIIVEITLSVSIFNSYNPPTPDFRR